MGSIGRYMFRTTFGAFLIVLVGLTGAIWMTQALREVDLMTSQGQTVLVFVAITSLIIPNLVLVIAPVALVTAVSHNLHKLTTDSEIIVMNGAGIEDNDQFGIGGAYKLRDTVQVGLNYIDNGDDRFIDVNDIDGDGDFFEILEESAGDTIVLYGSFEVAPLTTIEAYVANNDSDGKETDTAFGLGGNYDLGGARLSGAIERGYDEKIRADAGVRFDF